MSYRRTQRKETAKNPFCKVCKDAGKSEKEYTSHFIRQTPHPESPVVCPTILSFKCNFCNCIGHSSSKCQVKKDMERTEKRKSIESRKDRSLNVVEKKSGIKSNNFAVLNNFDSDDEVEKEQFHISENVTVRKKKPINWCDLYDSDTDDEE